MSGRGGTKLKKVTSKSEKANVTFPVARMHRYLKKGTHHLRIGIGSPVYMAAVIEYLTGKSLLLTEKKVITFIIATAMNFLLLYLLLLYSTDEHSNVYCVQIER